MTFYFILSLNCEVIGVHRPQMIISDFVNFPSMEQNQCAKNCVVSKTKKNKKISLYFKVLQYKLVLNLNVIFNNWKFHHLIVFKYKYLDFAMKFAHVSHGLTGKINKDSIV